MRSVRPACSFSYFRLGNLPGTCYENFPGPMVVHSMGWKGNIMLKAIYDTLEEIPEQYRDLYEERSGKFMIKKIEGLITQADLDRVQGALTKERNDHKATKEKYKGFGEMTAEQLTELQAKAEKVTELETRLGENENATKTVDQRVAAIVDARVERETRPLLAKIKEHEATIATNTTTIGELDGKLKQGIIKDAVHSAAAKLKVVPEALEDVMLNAGRLFEFTEAGVPIMKENVGFQPGIDVETWLGDMKVKRPFWWPPSQGGGAGGGNGNNGAGNNPFAKRAFNREAAQQLIRSDAAKAETMARAMGWTSAVQAAAMTDQQLKAAGVTTAA